MNETHEGHCPSSTFRSWFRVCDLSRPLELIPSVLAWVDHIPLVPGAFMSYVKPNGYDAWLQLKTALWKHKLQCNVQWMRKWHTSTAWTSKCQWTIQNGFLLPAVVLKEVEEGSMVLDLMHDQRESSSIYLVVISSKCIIKTNYTPHNVTGKRFSVPKAFRIFTASIKYCSVSNCLSGSVSRQTWPLISCCWSRGFLMGFAGR